jgi:hypothetical protein
MGYTLGAAAKAVGMSKTSILRSIKAGRISATRDDFGHWCIEPVELHRVYPAVTDVTEANGTGERAVSGGDAALVEANVRASLLEQRLSDLKAALNDMRGQRDDMREQRDRWQAQAERLAALAITDQRREAAPRSRSPGGDGCELERH